ncbi:hypothetical protein [Luteolibacter marinus]|uniref:hypothetical protein n=1 Tax=Luteolibacter marinus TaxID=2776705 RepID=UPI001866F15B|nr:hypothetical protein [Luteolibacter marinus]
MSTASSFFPLLVIGTLLSIAHAAEEAPLPAEADLRPRLTEAGLAPRAQGKRPTCSVFTFTGGLEFALAQARKDAGHLSVDFVNWAANQERQPPRDGGFFSDMWRGYARHGVCAEDEMPYRATFDADRRPDEKAAASAARNLSLGLTRHWLKKWDPRTGLSGDEFRSIKRTLAAGWPVCGGFRWPKHAKWELGILRMCGPDEVFDGHSVLLTGFRDDPSQAGGGVFLIRDSASGVDRAMPYAFAKAFMNDALWIGWQP